MDDERGEPTGNTYWCYFDPIQLKTVKTDLYREKKCGRGPWKRKRGSPKVRYRRCTTRFFFLVFSIFRPIQISAVSRGPIVVDQIKARALQLGKRGFQFFLQSIVKSALRPSDRHHLLLNTIIRFSINLSSAKRQQQCQGSSIVEVYLVVEEVLFILRG